MSVIHFTEAWICFHHFMKAVEVCQPAVGLLFATDAVGWKWWHRMEELNLTTHWIVAWL